jgi:DNA-binding transcriptional LysR family regulator
MMTTHYAGSSIPSNLIGVTRVLDIGPLRSFVAVADCGGFQRAAAALHLTQGAVSQHVRKLESALGRALVERDGRGSRFTADGETLLARARRILAAHDETLAAFAVEDEPRLTIGSTEHAADHLLPALAAAFPEHRVRFRIDRGAELRAGLAEGRIDLALLIGPGEHTVGSLPLTWYSASDLSISPRVDLVAFDPPCALRTRALETLAATGIKAEVGCEAANLAGVRAAVRAGLGVALMATFDEKIDGLVVRDDLPPAEPLALSIWPRRGLSPDLLGGAADALRSLL